MSLQANFPTIRPSLLLDFANAQALDPRVTFTRASTATYFDGEGVLRTAASGQARFAFDPVTEESLGLLIEEARTNLLTYSEQFDNAAWSKIASAITANTVYAPDGTLTADKVVENSASSVEHYVEQTISTNTNQAYTQSIYVKAGETPSFRIMVVAVGSTATTSVARFLVTAGVVSVVLTDGLITSASAIDVGNGWYRCTVAYTLSGTVTSHRMRVYPRTDGVYTGDGTSGIYVWGAQLEAGSFATSYIPTVASQVTRAGDLAVMTGVNFSSWFNNAEGTIVGEWQKLGASSFQSVVSLSDGTVNNQITLSHSSISGSNNNMRFDVNAAAATQASLTLVTGSASNTFYKNAGAYKINDFAGVSNAGAVQSDSLGLIPVTSQLNVGVNASASGGYLNGTIKKLAYYPVRLSNATLQALTR